MKTLLLILLLPFTAIAATTTVRVQVTFVDPTTIQPATTSEEAIIITSDRQEKTIIIKDDIVEVIYL